MEQTKSPYNKIVVLCLYLYAAFVFMFNADATKNRYIYLAFILLAGLLMVGVLRRGRLHICRELILLVLYTLVGFLSVFWGVDTNKVTTMAKTLLILTALAVLLYDWNFKARCPEVLLKAIILGGTCEAIYFILLYGLDTVLDAITAGYRIGFMVNNPNAVGNSIAISLVAIFGYAICYRRYKALLLAVPNLVVLFAANSRTAVVSLLVGIAVVTCAQLRSISDKKGLKRLTTVILVVVGVIAGWNVIKTMPFLAGITQRFEDLIGVLTETNAGGAVGDDSAEHRMEYMILGLQQFLDTPILGNGLGCAGYVIKEKYGIFTYLHNNVAEILASGGLVGFGLYYGMYVLAMPKHFRLLKTRNPIVTVSLGLMCTELISHIGCVNYYSKIVYLLFVLWFSVANGDFTGSEEGKCDEEGLDRCQ